MTRRRVALFGLLVTVVALAAGVVIVGIPRWFRAVPPPAAVASAPTADPAGRKIKARLFYVADDGLHLTSVERDVPYAGQTSDEAREIINAQIAPATLPLVSAIPSGTTLRALYVTPMGEAFVDLSQEVATAHPGGSQNELLTIYTVVHALTMNLPAITSVQLLVDGKEVDTLAGHVDLRRPLAKHLQLILEAQP